MSFSFLLVLLACGRSDAVRLTLVNGDADPVHLVEAGFENFGPSNRVEPGESLSIVVDGGTVSIAAGRNGAEIARSDLDLSPLEDEEAAEDECDADEVLVVKGTALATYAGFSVTLTEKDTSYDCVEE
ncbi:MAG: hypothetical protein H6737_30965 [Alphaproteobacteria bacterium]|nr:hypothetical protein [Alphaproteobacteria bacterium]